MILNCSSSCARQKGYNSLLATMRIDDEAGARPPELELPGTLPDEAPGNV